LGGHIHDENLEKVVSFFHAIQVHSKKLNSLDRIDIRLHPLAASRILPILLQMKQLTSLDVEMDDEDMDLIHSLMHIPLQPLALAIYSAGSVKGNIWIDILNWDTSIFNKYSELYLSGDYEFTDTIVHELTLNKKLRGLRVNLHGISQTALDTLCDDIEKQSNVTSLFLYSSHDISRRNAKDPFDELELTCITKLVNLKKLKLNCTKFIQVIHFVNMRNLEDVEWHPYPYDEDADADAEISYKAEDALINYIDRNRHYNGMTEIVFDFVSPNY